MSEDSDAMLFDEEPDMMQLVQEAMQIDERRPPPPLSPRKRTVRMQPSGTSSARLKTLKEIYQETPSQGNDMKTSQGTPSGPLGKLKLASSPPKPSSLSYSDAPSSPSPRERQPFDPTGSRLQQSKPKDRGKSPQKRYISISSESEGEEDTPSPSPSKPPHSARSRTTPATSISALPSPKFTLKPTLEYGDSVSAPLKRTRTSGDSSADSASTAPSPKLRRTSSEHLPRHTRPPAESSVLHAPSHENASSSNTVPREESPKSSLTTVIISHSNSAQSEMDRLGVAWGVQYEIARGVTRGRWTWEDAIPKLDQLTGSNQDAAAKVANVILGPDYAPLTNGTIWQELDREQRALVENDDCRRGLGAYGDFEQEPDWYGGRIIQIARLVQQAKGAPFEIKLDSLDYKKATTRLARFFGSRRVLRLNISKEILYNEKVREFICQKFVLCGRVFVPLRPKDDKVYLIEVSEDYERSPLRSEGDHLRFSFQQLMNWHNPPIEANSKQPVRKWTARFDLILSTSIPVLEFQLENIHYLEDEYVPSYDPKSGKKASAEQIVTDGCGYMNRGALSAISKHLGMQDLPTAVQGRIAGAKGVWLLHPEYQHDPNETPKIWIRGSQYKIHIPDDQMDRAHRIFDHVAPNRVTFPARLSMQTIMNLSQNGVPDSVFVKLMEEGMSGDFEKLTTWKGPNAMKVCMHAVGRAGNVAGLRLQRQTAGMGRALGYVSREKDKEDWDEPVEAGDHEAPVVAGRHPVSLQPAGLGEKIFEMIAAGFHPLEYETLNSDLRQLVKNILDSYIKSYHIPNPQSCEAFIVPDPFGMLAENEIYFRASQNIKDPQADCNPELLTGPVLINRNPTRLPSDVQLVEAVDRYHDIYQNYRGVIICSTKGDCSFASKLAGGDYDGDTAMLTWMPELVSAFRPAPLEVMPPDFLEKNFKKSVETLAEFQQRISKLPEAQQELEFHRAFLLGLGDSKVGLYSRFHDNAIYQHGYAHEISVRQGHMFCVVLDSVKSGLEVLPEVLKRDKGALDRLSPACMPKGTEGPSGVQLLKLRRPNNLGPFILETLCDRGQKLFEGYLEKYDHLQTATRLRSGGDEDLKSLFVNAKNRALATPGAEIVHDALIQIEKHVDVVFKMWQDLWARSSSPSKKTPSRKASKKDRSQELDLNSIRKQYAEDIPGVEILELLGNNSVELLKASCAYGKGTTEKFVHAVAFRDLCLIKAGSRGKPAAMASEFAEILGIPAAFARLWAQP